MREYQNIVILDNPKDATLIAGKEGYGNVNVGMNDIYPVNLIIPKRRNRLKAILKSWQYSRMGIFNTIVEVS